MQVATADPASGTERKASSAQALLARYHCGTCHTIPGVAAARSRFAADLSGYGNRSYIAGHVPNTLAELTRWIQDPPSVVPGTLMPNLGVSSTDAREMASYLRSLR
jgi:cytochrome c